jgi:hypothetical protein
MRAATTTYDRADWERAADTMLRGVRPWTSPDHARIDLPGAPGAYGRDSDALEGFARTFLLAAIRLRGAAGADPDGLADWWAAGLRAGPAVWPRPDQLGQAKVEAAGIALGLHLSRPWLWDRLDGSDQERLIDWLGTVVGADYPPINWVWFQLVVEAFLREVGGPWSAADVASGLAVHESLYRGDGWYADGPERAYDHYNGWALQLYPLLWAEMAGDLCPGHLRDQWRERLARFLDDAVHLIGADGAPLIQGRSLIYRFAAAAPFWVGALTGATNLSPGLTRRACNSISRYFWANGSPNRDGLLTLGWHREWPAMKQSYSGPGSPYWAAKGMLGLLLPAEHPVWTAPEEPLPVETADFERIIAPPGWQVSGVRADGIVRVVNHGTDHAREGDERTDAPLYARLAYSTATFPTAHDNAICLVRAGVRSERAGFTAGIGISRARLRWVTPGPPEPDHASGRSGTVVQGPHMIMASVVRGPVEVRLCLLEEEPPPDTVLEFTGWPTTTGRTSHLVPLAGFQDPITGEERTTSPLGDDVRVPLLRTTAAPQVRQIHAAAVVLLGDQLTPAEVRDNDVTGRPRGGPGNDSRAVPPLPRVHCAATHAKITWPDGSDTQVDLARADGSTA